MTAPNPRPVSAFTRQEQADAARREALAFYGESLARNTQKPRVSEPESRTMGGAHRGPLRAVSPAGLAPSASTEGTKTMVSPTTDTKRHTPRTPASAAVLGAEIDHLRLYRAGRYDIANRLGCSVDAVDKWIKAHPVPRESWEVSA